MTTPLPRKLFTAVEYNKMIEAGVFDENLRLELIDGDIFEMSPVSSQHITIVNRLNRILSLLLANVAIVNIKKRVVLNENSVPQPDLSLIKWREENYAQGLPVAEDILVVIEVSDTPSEEIRDANIPVYARAGLPEVWLTDLYNDRIEIYSQPLKGKFRNIRTVQRGQEVFSKTIPQLKLHADEILG